MSEFDEWYSEKGEKLHIYGHEKWIAKHGFGAGQQSQQAKIDELQARVNEIASHLDINFDEDRDDDQHSYWSGYNQAMRELNDILKGNKDEN